MSQLVSVIPNGHKAHTLHDTNLLPSGTCYLLIGVTTAGVLRLRTYANPDDNLDLYVALGTHQILGRFKLALSTGTTAVLSPATTVIAQTYDPNIT